MSSPLLSGYASARAWVRRCLLILTVFGASGAALAGARLLTHPAADTSFVLDAEGQLWAWGDNTDGALGDGTRESRAQPRPVTTPGVTRWRTAAPGRRVLAVDQDQRLWAWGYGRQGGSDRPILLSQPVARWQAVAALPGLDANLLIAETGQAWLWQFVGKTIGSPAGFSGYFLGPVEAPGAAGRGHKVAGGDSHALLLTESGQLFAYGSNHLAQCGPAVGSAFAAALAPVPSPEPGRAWVDLACGADTSFGRLSNGEWYFWGAAFVHGSNGVATVATREPIRLRRPKEVATWEQVVAGSSFILLRSEDGRAYGLGDNFFGALAYPWQRQWSLSYTNEPRRIFPVGPQTNQVAVLAAGLNHALALDEHGELYTWGNNASGQIGRPANGSAWQPDRVFGSEPPLSPTAAPWPMLEWVAGQTALIAPVLAGQPGQVARYEIRRRAGPPMRVPIVIEPTSPHSLPAIPYDRMRLFLNGVPQPFPMHQAYALEAYETNLTVELVPDLSPYPATAVTLALRATAPTWVVWTNTNLTPLSVTIPTQWSQPPTGETYLRGGPQMGKTNQVEVVGSDPDGWVSAVELWAQCDSCVEAELIGRHRFSRGFAGQPNQVSFPWAPVGPGYRAQAWIGVIAVLRDNAGSVVTNETNWSMIEPSAPFPADRFRVSWTDPAPVVELPGVLELLIEELLPGAPVTYAAVSMFNGHGWVERRIPEIPGRVTIPLTEPGSLVCCKVIIAAEGAGKGFRLPDRWVMVPGGLPYVEIEASDAEASEVGDPGAFRVTRHGSDLSRPLTVTLTTESPDPGVVPVPRRGAFPFAELEVDCEPLSAKWVIPYTFSPGQRQLEIPVHPLDDPFLEGNEGLVLKLVPKPDTYEIIDERQRAMVVIRDDELPAAPTVTLRRLHPEAPQRAGQPLELSFTFTATPGSVIEERELFADGQSLGNRSTLPAPLPVGRMVLQGRGTDAFGQVAWSAPLTVVVVPELRLRGREARADGTELWRVEATPDFQELRLETAPNLDDWQPGLDWRPSPTNRVREVVVPAGADAHFLRLIPAHP